MASQPVPYVTPEEYLKFDRSAEVRHEYVFGEIVAMAGGTYNHSAITVNTIIALSSHLRGKPCRVLEANLRLALREHRLFAYPDVTVVCGQPEFLDEKRDTIVNPKVVVEVLSPTTRNFDLGDKTRAYLQIPSLVGLLLVEQDKVWIEYWSREPGGKWDRNVLSEPGEVLKIESPDCEIPVAEIYSQVEMPVTG